jgi:hypothetical protein
MSVCCNSTSRIRNVPTTLHTEFLWLFQVFTFSILVVVLKRQLTSRISFLCFHHTCHLVASYGMITRVHFMARGMHFSLSYHVQPGRGANPVFSPVSFFPWTWSCQNMKLTAHSFPLRRRFLRWFWCTIDNIWNIVLTAFSITIFQKLCTVMPHALNDDIHKVTFKYNFWGEDRISHKVCNLTSFWNILLSVT